MSTEDGVTPITVDADTFGLALWEAKRRLPGAIFLRQLTAAETLDIDLLVQKHMDNPIVRQSLELLGDKARTAYKIGLQAGMVIAAGEGDE